MNWSHYIACFFGGVFLANALPHVVSGSMGRPFQTPFAKPRGQGLSSSTLNVLWGFANLVFAYLLLCRAAGLDPHVTADVAVTASGAFLISMFLARRFGRFNGGNTPTGS
jgi:hypothetical protein